MNYYEIRDRVPCEEIDALTVEAARVWLERNGWELRDWVAHPDATYWRYVHADERDRLSIASTGHVLDESRGRMAELIERGAGASDKRAHVVIAEIRAIAEWQRRCKEWVEPKEGGNCSCWACECKYADAWEAPPVRKFVPSCPTCDNGNCPRATDHRNECSGSNEPGQEGSRYA